MASKLTEATEAFKTKLQGVLPLYNIITAINCEGYDNPFIVLDSYYNPVSDGTALKAKKILYKIDILIGREFSAISDPGGETAREQLREDIEKILNLSIVIDTGDIKPAPDCNRGNPAQTEAFTITL